MAADATLYFLNVLPSAEQALATLASPVQVWFRTAFDKPTRGQRLAWPALAQGHHVLLAAPTGSGKTLAAFLPILSALLQEQQMAVRCLYVAPLKALCSDAAKNLKRVAHQFVSHLPPDAPKLNIGLRTGDSSAAARRHLLIERPAILLTTPESLAVMLTQEVCHDAFRTIRWIVVDEVHALAEQQRGADLSLALERLEHIIARSGNQPPRRIGLSATCMPLPAVARYLAGAGRTCAIAQVEDDTPFTLTTDLLPRLPGGVGFVNAVLERLEPELKAHRTTLIFADVRSVAERLTWALKRRWPECGEQFAVHHSSLSIGQRRLVEQRLKDGELCVVVSSTSLELG